MLRELSEQETKQYIGDPNTGVFCVFGAVIGSQRLILIETQGKYFLASRGEFIFSGVGVRLKEKTPLSNKVNSLLEKDIDKE